MEDNLSYGRRKKNEDNGKETAIITICNHTHGLHLTPIKLKRIKEKEIALKIAKTI